MNKIASITVTDKFDKIKNELTRDLQIIQTEYTNSQKKLKLAEEIFQKSKQEYKKLNDEYNKLVQYKDKCEKYIQELKQQINNLQQELNTKKNHHVKYSIQHRPRQYYSRQRQEQEEQDEEEEEDNEYEDELYHQDIDENEEYIDNKNIVKPPPKKKIKKGISKYI